MLGQDAVVASLEQMIERNDVPHALILSGPSGCGKTTVGRILKTHLECGDADWFEINAADAKGIDVVRDIRRYASLSPMEGNTRIFLIDEAGKLTGDAQNALLKPLEDSPSHAYFILATTDPGKLLKTIHTRCTEIKFRPLELDVIRKLVKRVVEKEDMKVNGDVIDEIAEAAEGSARKALVILEQVGWLDDVKAQLAGVSAASVHKDQAILLARALINPRARWAEVAALLKENKDDPEQVRYLLLGYARSVMLGGGKLAPRAFVIIDIFARNFYDSKQAGLAAACWEVIHMTRK